MPFNNDLGEWNKTDPKPSQTKLDTGFSALEKPSASLFNWFFNKTYLAIKDLVNNAIHKDQKGVANGVASLDATGKVPSAQLNIAAQPDATTTTKGIVQLNDTVTSTSITQAATPNAVKQVKDAIPLLNDTITSTSTTQAATPNAVKQVVDWAKSFGLGDVAKDIASTDLNNLDATGFYKGSSLINAPNGSAVSFFIINFKSQVGHKSQIASKYAVSNTEIYHRINNNGTWSAWTQVATYDTNGKIAVANLPTATATTVGVVQLNDTITSTLTTQGATANAVKQVYDFVTGWGLGTNAKSISSTDLNTLTETGFYKGDTLTNAPSPYVQGIIVNIRYDASPQQIFFPTSADKMFIRRKNGGTWTAWIETETTIGSQAKADAVKTWANAFGIGANGPNVADPNTITESGFYTITGSVTNVPSGVTGASLIHNKRDGSRPTQILVDYLNNRMYFRSYQVTGWTAWDQSATTGLAQMVKNTDDNGISLSYGGDMNTLTAYGDYYVTAAATNRPSGFGGGLCMVRRIVNTTNTYQIMIDFSSGAFIIRYWNGTTWNFTNTIETSTGAQAKVDIVKNQMLNNSKKLRGGF